MLHGKYEEKTNFEFFIFCFRELGDNINEDELKAMIDEFDLDGDGESKLITVRNPSILLVFSQFRRISGYAQFRLKT